MDIDDILAAVDQELSSSPASTALDHQLLTRFWVAERAVPELLPWPGPLMDRMMERVRKQVSLINPGWRISPSFSDIPRSRPSKT
jgi:GINS complex subunit 4